MGQQRKSGGPDGGCPGIRARSTFPFRCRPYNVQPGPNESPGLVCSCPVPPSRTMDDGRRKCSSETMSTSYVSFRFPEFHRAFGRPHLDRPGQTTGPPDGSRRFDGQASKEEHAAAENARNAPAPRAWNLRGKSVAILSQRCRIPPAHGLWSIHIAPCRLLESAQSLP